MDLDQLKKLSEIFYYFAQPISPLLAALLGFWLGRLFQPNPKQTFPRRKPKRRS